MTLFKFVDQILNSRTFKTAMETGNLKNLRILLHQSHFAVYDNTQKRMVKMYGKVKGQNKDVIKTRLYSVPPPSDLDLDGKLLNLDLFDQFGMDHGFEGDNKEE